MSKMLNKMIEDAVNGMKTDFDERIDALEAKIDGIAGDIKEIKDSLVK